MLTHIIFVRISNATHVYFNANMNMTEKFILYVGWGAGSANQYLYLYRGLIYISHIPKNALFLG